MSAQTIEDNLSETKEKSEEKEENSVGLDKTLKDDIDAAVELSLKKDDNDNDDPDEDDNEELEDEKISDEKDEDTEEPSEEADEDLEEDDNVSDELLEKAISLGVNIAEARKLGASLLSAKVTELEKSASAADENGDESDADESIEDSLAKVPDLDPEAYEPELVDGFKAMKDIIRSQDDTIKSLSQSAEVSVFDSKVSSLGEDMGKVLLADPEKRTQLKEKFDVLTAGYESVGKDIDNTEVFSEAASAILGEDMAKVAENDKKVKSKAREKQKIQRAAGGKNSSPETDVLLETADKIDREFFDKK